MIDEIFDGLLLFISINNVITFLSCHNWYNLIINLDNKSVKLNSIELLFSVTYDQK